MVNRTVSDKPSFHPRKLKSPLFIITSKSPCRKITPKKRLLNCSQTLADMSAIVFLLNVESQRVQILLSPSSFPRFRKVIYLGSTYWEHWKLLWYSRCPRLEMAGKSFSYKGTNLWNDIPNKMRNVGSAALFKKQVATYFLSQGDIEDPLKHELLEEQHDLRYIFCLD